MTDDMMSLQSLLEKSTDADLLRAMWSESHFSPAPNRVESSCL